MNRKYNEDEDALLVEQIQSALQEKRTALKAIRMGISVVLVFISAIAFLVTAFGRRAFFQVMPYENIFVVLAVISVCIAIFLVVYPLIRIHRLNRKILKSKQKRNKMLKLTNPRI